MSLGLIGPALPSVARAQQTEGHVGVLRSTSASTPAELANELDALLLRDLAELAGITDPVVSPVDYGDVQLNVGCSDETRACLEAIARAANTGALLIRSVSSEGDVVRLELRYFDSTSSDESRTVRAELTKPTQDQLGQAVAALVRELFGIPEVAEPAQSTVAQPASPPATASTSSDAGERRSSSIVPWLLMGAGAAALTAGIVIGTVAADDFRAWKKHPVRSTEDAEQANADFDDLETRALAANILMPAGAVVLGLGATLLVLQLGDDEANSHAGTSLALEPRTGGALLRVRSTFGEAW